MAQTVSHGSAARNVEVSKFDFGYSEGGLGMRFDLVDLRLFLHVTEAGSVTHGAQRSNLALAFASARIRGMEIALAVPLRGVALLPAGQCLLEHARLIVQQVEHMRGELGSFARGLAGSVRLLSNTAALSEYLPRVLAGFLAANPMIVSMSRSARARTLLLPWDPGQLTWGLPPLPCCQTLSSSFHFATTCLFSFSLSVRKRREGGHLPWPRWSIALLSAYLGIAPCNGILSAMPHDLVRL